MVRTIYQQPSPQEVHAQLDRVLAQLKDPFQRSPLYCQGLSTVFISAFAASNASTYACVAG